MIAKRSYCVAGWWQVRLVASCIHMYDFATPIAVKELDKPMQGPTLKYLSIGPVLYELV